MEKKSFLENELFSENRTLLKFSFHDELFTSLLFPWNKLLVGFRGGLSWWSSGIGDLRQFYFLSKWLPLSLSISVIHTHPISRSYSHTHTHTHTPLCHDEAKFRFLFFNFKLISPGKLSSPWSWSRRTFGFSWELTLLRSGWVQSTWLEAGLKENLMGQVSQAKKLDKA